MEVYVIQHRTDWLACLFFHLAWQESQTSTFKFFADGEPGLWKPPVINLWGGITEQKGGMDLLLWCGFCVCSAMLLDGRWALLAWEAQLTGGAASTGTQQWYTHKITTYYALKCKGVACCSRQNTINRLAVNSSNLTVPLLKLLLNQCKNYNHHCCRFASVS